MMYGTCCFALQAALPREERVQLEAQLRRYPTVKAVVAEERRVRVWYQGTLPAHEIRQQR